MNYANYIQIAPEKIRRIKDSLLGSLLDRRSKGGRET